MTRVLAILGWIFVVLGGGWAAFWIWGAFNVVGGAPPGQKAMALATGLGYIAPGFAVFTAGIFALAARSALKRLRNIELATDDTAKSLRILSEPRR